MPQRGGEVLLREPPPLAQRADPPREGLQLRLGTLLAFAVGSAACA